MRTLAVTAATLRRLLRDRTSMFFVVVLPVAIILLLGVTIRGQGSLRVGVVEAGQGPLAREVVAALDASPALGTSRFAAMADARTALRRDEIAGIVEVPADLDARLSSGTSASVVVTADAKGSNGPTLLAAVNGAVSSVGARVAAARFAAGTTPASFATALTTASEASRHTSAVTVRTVTARSGSDYLPQGFGYSAPTMLVLFVFINALASGAAIIQTRRLGIYSRALAAPVRTRQLVAGETLGYLMLALLQSAIIITIGAALFGVSWGDPLAASVLVLVWALVGTGAGVLSGTVFRTEDQASAIGPTVGIAAGMLGGCMWPLAIVPPVMRTVGHLVPQAWAVDAWTELLSRGGGLTDIARQLAVLASFAAVLLGVAAWRLRTRLAS